MASTASAHTQAVSRRLDPHDGEIVAYGPEVSLS